jgi:hypothetical protein
MLKMVSSYRLDYVHLRPSERISRIDRIRNETIRTNMGTKKDFSVKRTAIFMVRPRRANGLPQNCQTGCRMEPTGEKESLQIRQHMEGWD